MVCQVEQNSSHRSAASSLGIVVMERPRATEADTG
jgi:hypothetical protein